MKRKLATLFVLLCSAFVALGFASCQMIEWQPDSGVIDQYNRYTLELDTSEYDPIVPYGGAFDYQSVKIVYKAYVGEKQEAFYQTKFSLTASMVTGGLDTSSVGDKELTIEYGGEYFTLPYTVKYQVDFLSKGEVFDRQYVLNSDEVVVPEAKEQEGFTFAYWKSEVPEVLTGNLSIEAHYYNDALSAPALESIDCTYDPDATIALLTLPSNENGTWTFVDPTMPVGEVGEHKFEVRFVSKTDEIAPVQNEFVQVQVAQKILSTPLVNASLIYNAEVQKATVTDVETEILPYEIVNNGGVDVGKYVVTATLKDVKNYAWKEGDGWTKADETGKVTFEYVISPKQVEFVILSETFTYNREEQFPTYQFKDSFDNAHITAADVTVTGTPQRNADTYEYGFAMSNPNYVGSCKGSFTIDPKELSFLVESESFVYDGTERYPVYSFADPKDTPNVRVMSGKAQTEVGTYKYGWLIMDDNYTGMYTGTFQITKPDVTVTVVLEKTEIVYPDSLPEITFAVDGFAGDEALLKITCEKPSLSVGTYEITPVVDNANVNATCVSATLTIKKGEATFYRPTLSTDGLTGTAAVYGDTISTVTFSDEGFGTWAWKEPDLIIDKMSDFSAIAVFTPQNPNLNKLEREFFITNEYRQIEKRLLDIVVTKDEYTYTGKEFALEYTIVNATLPTLYTIDFTKLTLVGNDAETNAGEYSKTLEIVSDYYKGMANCKLTIHKADIAVTLTSDKETLQYRPDLTLENCGVTLGGKAIRTNDNKAVNGTYAWEDATCKLYGFTIGEATSVKVVFTPDDMNNYNVGVAYFNFTIVKADSKIQKLEGGNKLDLAEIYTKVFDNQAYTFTATVDRDVAGDYPSYTYVYKDSNGQVVNEVKDAGEYTLTIVASETAHYKGAEATVNIVVTQASNQWGTANQEQKPYMISDAWTYKQNAATIYANAVWGISTLTIEYKNTTTGTVYQNQLPIDAQAGSYTATLCIPETSNWKGLEATVNFTINKAKVAIPTVAFESNNQNSIAYNGERQIPAVNGTYKDGDVDGVAYTVTYPNDSTNYGTYSVTLTLTDNVNYVWSGKDSAEVAVGYSVTTATNEITSLTMKGWTYKGYDEKDNSPSVTAKFGTGTVGYTYYTDAQCTAEILLENLKNAGVGTYYVKASIAAAENGNYTSAEKVLSFTIVEGSLTGDFTKTYTITWKAGLTLNDVELDANYTWNAPDTALIAGSTNSYPAMYKIDNYEAVQGNLQVTVLKISGTVTANNATFTYGEHTFTLENGANTELNTLLGVSTNHGSDANEITYTISYQKSEGAESTTVTTIANAGVYIVTVKLAESDHYTFATTDVTVTVNKAKNNQTLPLMYATYGDYLSEAKDENGKTLSDYNDEHGEWSWETSGTVGDAGTQMHTAKYTPKAEYAVNYAERTVEVQITVAKKAVELPALTTTFTYNGGVQKPDVPANDLYTITWSNENSTNAGKYTVTLTLSSANYAWSGSGASIDGLDATYSYTIEKATLTVNANTAQTATYDDKVFEKLTLPTSTFKGKPVGTWSWNNVTAESTVGTAGEHEFVATCTLSGDDANNFNAVDSVTVTVTVGKATPTLTVTDNRSKVYDGTPFAFADGDITPSHSESVTISYSYQVEETDYEGLPTNAGTYQVTVTLSESANYLGTSTTVTVKIDKAEAPMPGTTSAQVGDTLSKLVPPTSTYGTWTWVEDKTFEKTGTYEVKAKFTPSENYKNNYKEYTTTLHISVGQTVVTTTFNVSSNVYTGKEIVISVNVKEGESSLADYSVTCDKAVVSGHSVTVTDAGTYTFTLTFTGSIEYSWNSKDGTVNGNTLTKTITIDKATNEWTTTPSIGEETTFTYGTTYEATAAATFGKVVISYYRNSTELDAQPVDAGTYTVKFSVEGTSNYTGLSGEITYTIKPAKATLSLDTTSVTYNHREQTRTVTVTANNTTLTSGTDYTVEGITTATDAGNYAVKVTLKNNNYVFEDNKAEATATWTIAKATVSSVSLTTNTFTYTGKSVELAYTVQTVDGNITLEKGTDYTTDNTETNVGDYTPTITLSENFAFVGGGSTQDLPYSITKASLTVTLTLNVYNWTYGAFDGAMNKLEGSYTKEFTDEVSVQYRYAANADGTNPIDNFDPTIQGAGTYYVQAYVEGSANYDGAASEWEAFTIAKAKVNVPAWVENTFTYNGGVQKPTIATSDLYTVTWNDGNSTNVGTYTFTLTLNGTANYEWNGTVQDSYTYEIKPATATWSLDKTSVTYNGSEQTRTVTVKALDKTLTSGDYEVSGNTATNAGSYEVKVTLKNNNYVFEDNKKEATDSWTIERAKVTAPALQNSTLTYNDSYQLPEKTGDKGTYTIGITGSDGNASVGVNVGTYTVTLTLNDTANYTWSDGSDQAKRFTYTITPATTTWSVDNEALTYNGSAQTRTVTVTALDKKLTNDTDYTVSGNTATNADTYTLTVTLINSNYVFADDTRKATASWKIEKKPIGVPTLTNDSFTYNGSVQTPTGLEGEGYTVSYPDDSTNVSEYTVMFTLDNNYQWAVEFNGTRTYTINQAKLKWSDFTFMIDNTEVSNNVGYTTTYGTTYSLSITSSYTFATLTPRYTGTATDGTRHDSFDAPTNAGSYSIRFEYDNTNYTIEGNYAIALTIKKAKPTLSVTVTEGTYYQNQIDLKDYFTGNSNVKGKWEFKYATDTPTGTTETISATVTAKFTSFDSNYEEGSESVTINLKGVAYIGSTYYGTIEAALDAATSGQTVYVVADKTGKVIVEDDCEVKTGVTLILPYDNNGGYNANATATEHTYEKIATSAKMITSVILDAKVTVNGTVIIAGVLDGGGGGASYAGHTSGNYAEFVLTSSAELIVNGEVKCYGFIREKSENNGSQVTVNKGGTLWMPFVLRDFRGGSYMYVLHHQEDSKHIAGFNQFEMRNVTSLLRVNYGGCLYAWANLYAGNQQNATDMKIIDSSSQSMLQLTNEQYSYVTAKYDEITEICDLNVYGGATLNNMTLTVKVLREVEVSTEKVYFPLTWRYHVTLHKTEGQSDEAKYYMNNRYKLMTGSVFTVEEGASLTVGQLMIYDEFNDTCTTSKNLNYPSKDPANFTVNGKLIVNTAIGGRINTNGNGQVTINSGVATTLTIEEAIEISGYSFTAKLKTTQSITNILALKKYSNAAEDYSAAGTYYGAQCSDGTYAWYPASVSISYETNGGNTIASATRNTEANGVGYIITDNDLPMPTITGAEFLGWYLDESLTQKVEKGTQIYGDTKLYAKWDAVIYSVEFKGADGKKFEEIKIKEGGYISSSNSSLPDLSDYNKDVTYQYAYTGKWYYYDENGAKVDFTATTPINGNLDVYAEYTEKYEVTLTVSGATVNTITVNDTSVATSLTTLYLKAGDKITIKAQSDKPGVDVWGLTYTSQIEIKSNAGHATVSNTSNSGYASVTTDAWTITKATTITITGL